MSLKTVPQFGFGVVFSLLLKLTFLLFMLAYWLLYAVRSATSINRVMFQHVEINPELGMMLVV
jgi:hypothetical protein